MSRKRWEQMKRYFHIENPKLVRRDHHSGLLDDSRFYHKVQWLAEHEQTIYMRIVDPGSVLSYDEAMIRFMGRVSNLVSASHKPIKEGYEYMALATPRHAHAYA